jgi:glycosyltransferase involved in cell wall biosynthesis
MEKLSTLQSCLSTAWGGLEMVAYETAIKMRDSGHTVVTVCPPGSPLQNKLVEAGLPTIGVDRGNKYFAPKAVKAFWTAIHSGQYSSVLVQQLNDLWQIVPAMWGKPDMKLVAISHSLVGISKRDPMHAWLYARIDHLVALTDIHKQNLSQCLPIKSDAIEVLPNTVDMTKFHPSKKSEAFRKQFLKSPDELLIGVVSRLDNRKGLLETVAAAEKMRDWKLKFQIVIVGKETVGEPGMKDTLESEIRRRHLRDHVQLAGHRSDIDSVIASFDVLLMPSPAETFGRVLIEAMSSGVPVVASNGGGVANIIHHEIDGLLVKPLDVQEMAEAMRFYYDHPERRARIANNGIEAVKETYDYRKVDQRLYGLLGLSV